MLPTNPVPKIRNYKKRNWVDELKARASKAPKAPEVIETPEVPETLVDYAEGTQSSDISEQKPKSRKRKPEDTE